MILFGDLQHWLLRPISQFLDSPCLRVHPGDLDGVADGALDLASTGAEAAGDAGAEYLDDAVDHCLVGLILPCSYLGGRYECL